MQQPNPLSPQRMTVDQRLHEIAQILAKGLLRLRNDSVKDCELVDCDSNSSLAIGAQLSVHSQPENTHQ